MHRFHREDFDADVHSTVNDEVDRHVENALSGYDDANAKAEHLRKDHNFLDGVDVSEDANDLEEVVVAARHLAPAVLKWNESSESRTTEIP